jgi:hypothetical protein
MDPWNVIKYVCMYVCMYWQWKNILILNRIQCGNCEKYIKRTLRNRYRSRDAFYCSWEEKEKDEDLRGVYFFEAVSLTTLIFRM